jgi:alkaline phosphatase D
VKCADLFDVRRTILGAAQEAWLFENLSKPTGRWTVLGQQVPTFARDMIASNPASRFSVDKWDGYAESRRRLFTRLRDAKVPNPIVLSGDVHNAWCAHLKTDFANPASPTVGVEFTNTSITSGGDGSDAAAAWPSMRGDNPHITFHHNRRGYVAVTVTSSTLRADFTAVDKVSERGAPSRIVGSRVVEAGHPGSQPA